MYILANMFYITYRSYKLLLLSIFIVTFLLYTQFKKNLSIENFNSFSIKMLMKLLNTKVLLV